MSESTVTEPTGEPVAVEPPEPESPWPLWVRRYVMPFLEESGLWPVLFALLGHIVVIIAPLLLALSRGGVAAAVPLTFLIMTSFWLGKTELQDRGRPGPVAVVIALIWVGSVIGAVICARTGIL